MDKHQLNWRSFADKRGKEDLGPICSRWNLSATPTLFVLDHKGVIRYHWVGSPGEKEIDKVLDKLLGEAQADTRR